MEVSKLWYVHALTTIPTEGVEMTDDDETYIEDNAKVKSFFLFFSPLRCATVHIA